jgi:hypothetical protein
MEWYTIMYAISDGSGDFNSLDQYQDIHARMDILKPNTLTDAVRIACT